MVDYFALRYDYQNLKVLVKAKFMKQDFSEFLVPIGTMPLNELKDLVNTRKSAHAEQPMIACIDEVFSYIEKYLESRSVVIIFDSHLWEQLWSIGR